MTITDLFTETRSLVDATSVSYVDADILRRMNTAMEDINGDLINTDGTFQFDDTNYTDEPIGTATLIEGQASYTFDNTFLEIENVKIEDAQGHWHILTPWDQSEDDIALEEYLRVAAFPRQYDKEANTITLLPPPTATVVTLTNGLKVQFKRTARLFTAGDIITGTITPGFASPFHVILAFKAALPYAMTYKKDRVGMIQNEIMRLHENLLDHYGSREKDRRKIMQVKPILFR